MNVVERYKSARAVSYTHLGSTFKQLIQEERLKAAANLLKTTSLPIVEIIDVYKRQG